MKTVFIICGFDIHDTAAGSRLIPLREGLAAKGYDAVPVIISWRRNTPSKFAEQFKAFYAMHKSERNIIIGNSFGAIVSFLAAPSLKPEALYLCSMSGFFKEDRGKLPDELGIRRFGAQRMHDLWSLSFNEIADQYEDLQIRTTVTYGERELGMYPVLVQRCREAAEKIPLAKLIELPGAAHSMSEATYTKELLKLL